MQELNPVMVVVLPARPPIDKLVAYKRVQLDRRYDVRLRVEFCDLNEPTPEQLALWQSMCSPGQKPFFIDVGEKKYHKLGSSAAEVEEVFSDTHSRDVFKTLVRLISENNQNGCLKNRRHSIPKLLREVYHVMNGGDNSQAVVFDHGMDVVNTFFSSQNKREWKDLFSDPQYLELKKLWNGFNLKDTDLLPFTIPYYFKQLFMSGRKQAEIITKITWWINKTKRVESIKGMTKNKRYFCRPFNIQGRPAALIHVNGHFEAWGAQYQSTGSGKFVVGIFRNELGQVHINGSFKHKEVNLNALYAKLNELECGRWYYEGRFNSGESQMLMNGSSQFVGVTPTSLSDDELIALVLEHVTFDRKL